MSEQLKEEFGLKRRQTPAKRSSFGAYGLKVWANIDQLPVVIAPACS